MILTPIAGPVINIVKAEAVGYLAIKDYLGTTWTLEDVEKIINTTIQTTTGELKSLADYFYIVIDDDTNNPINLRDFIASPLDNSTAVIPLPVGDHTVDIYWFGFHQRQLVNIVENTTYVLNLETAPVMPFSTAGEPPTTSYEWDLASNPDGLTISRRDGNAWVRFNYNQSYITVAWYDEDTGWNYQSLDIYIDTSYQYKFHIKDPSSPTYYEEKTGSFLWLSWDIYKVAEKIKWNRTGEILHLVYAVAISENQALFNAVDEFWRSVSRTVVEIASGRQFIDPVTSTIHRLEDFVIFVQSAYDTWMGELYSSKYQKTVLIVWDVFATPTQVVVLAHCYDVDQNGNLVKKSITSSNAFTIDNRLVYVKQLSGGSEYIYTRGLVGPLYTRTSAYNYNNYYTYVSCSYELDVGGVRGHDQNNPHINMPCGNYFKFIVDDLSKYDINVWVAFNHKVDYDWSSTHGTVLDTAYTKYNLQVQIVFDDTSKADLFEQRLTSNNIQYSRSGNTFTITVTSNSEKQMPWNSGGGGVWVSEALYFDGLSSIGVDKLIPENSSGYITFKIDGYLRVNEGNLLDGSFDETRYYIDRFRLRVTVHPKMTPPQINLLKDGYQIVSGAFAVQVYTDLFRTDNDSYVLGYYILNNEPPPSYIIRDVHPDIENDMIHYVYTIISADCYGQDIVDMTKTYNETTHVHEWYLNIKPTIRTFSDVTLALFNLNRMSFLNLAPEIIEYLLAIPPNEGGYGTPILDWATVSAITLNFSRPYELYYYNKENDEWIRVKPVYYNDTKIYDIVRYSDNVLIEKLNVSEISQYYYKLIYTDDNSTYKGWLWNDNGTLKMITGQVTWSLTNAELQQLLAMVQLEGIMDQWAQAWEDIARKLGLISEGLVAAANWFNANWIYLLLGFFGVMFMILLIFALASRPRITVAVPRTR